MHLTAIMIRHTVHNVWPHYSDKMNDSCKDSLFSFYKMQINAYHTPHPLVVLTLLAAKSIKILLINNNYSLIGNNNPIYK